MCVLSHFFPKPKKYQLQIGMSDFFHLKTSEGTQNTWVSKGKQNDVMYLFVVVCPS